MSELPDDLALLYATHLDDGADAAVQLGRRVSEKAHAITQRERRWLSVPRWAKLIRLALEELTERTRIAVSVSLLCSFELGENLLRGIPFTLGSQMGGMTTAYYRGVAQAKVAFSLDDLHLLVAVDGPRLSRRPEDRITLFGMILDRTETLLASKDFGAMSVLDEVTTRIINWRPVGLSPTDMFALQRLRDRAATLTGTDLPFEGTQKPIEPSDGFGVALLSWIDDAGLWTPNVSSFLSLLASATGSRPTKSWEKQLVTLAADMETSRSFLHSLIEVLLAAEPIEVERWGAPAPVLLYESDDLARGAVWAAGILKEPWAPRLLERVARRYMRESQGRSVHHVTVRGEKVPMACIYALARYGDDQAFVVLSRLSQTFGNRTFLKRIYATLEPVARERGMTVDELLETVTPDYGFDSDGVVDVLVKEGAARIELDDRSGANLSLTHIETTDHQPLTSEAELDTGQSLLSEIRGSTRAVRRRIEAMFAVKRSFDGTVFKDQYVTHALAGWFGRRLIWQVDSPSDGPFIGIPATKRDGSLVGLDGERRFPISDGHMSLWHPIDAELSDVDAARRLVFDLGITQPAGQAWRETFHPDDLELTTQLFTNRYAGHVLRHKAFFGMARSRGWAGGYLTNEWTGGQTSRCERAFADRGIRAVWFVAAMDWETIDRRVDLCVTGRLQFEVVGEDQSVPIPISDVPARVFSEALRDLDQIVSGCTVATDPAWLEKVAVEQMLSDYWERVASDGLGTYVSTRRQIIEVLIAAGMLEGQVEASTSGLLVAGTRGNYQIDFGTGNVRCESNGKWLAFGRSTSQTTVPDSVRLPMSDDEVLDRIIARATLLVHDDAVTDRVLLRQLKSAS
jgi:hypothetical protein